MTNEEFKAAIRAGIPDVLPEPREYDKEVNHAPKRKEILTEDEKKLALRNALRYFPKKFHKTLAPEFAAELRDYGRIYMYRFRPTYDMYARSIDEYPHKSEQAAAIMLMIQNNLNPAVAQHPHELIVYGGNGAAFQNWAQYLLTMKYLSEMTDEQTLVMYSGHPLGLFPSHKNAPRVVVTNGMVIPNYSKPDDWERMNALGVSQYGQMTAGSYMYIGPQGIVHGTTITVLNAARMQMKKEPGRKDIHGMLFVSSGLGGMSGAQPKAGNIAGVVSVVAEINPKAAQKRYDQGWVDELHSDQRLAELTLAIRNAAAQGDEITARFLKQQTLPYVTPCGVFTRRRSDCLTEPSGLVVVDIDHLESAEETENLRQQLFDDPYLCPALVFISPTGRGVKAFVPCLHGQNPAEGIQWAMNYVHCMYDAENTQPGKGVDTSGKDLVRAYFSRK